tara:strand:+ start:314 stop:712 length:399 start_codon:yes stop_codon:yes gene_type:complete
MKNIFLPFYYNDLGLRLVVMQTWDRPVRYFSDKKSSFLTPYWRAVACNDKSPADLIKQASSLRFDEESGYRISYVIEKVVDSDYIVHGEGLKSIGIHSMDDLFSDKLKMPAELKLGIMQVITNELTEHPRAA